MVSKIMNNGTLEVKSEYIDILMDRYKFYLFTSCNLKIVCDTCDVHYYLEQGLIGEYVFSDSVVEYYLTQLIESYLNGCVEEYILENNVYLKRANIDVKYIKQISSQAMSVKFNYIEYSPVTCWSVEKQSL